MERLKNEVIEVMIENACSLAAKAKKKNIGNDTKGYIDIMRALRDTMDIIEKYERDLAEIKKRQTINKL